MTTSTQLSPISHVLLVEGQDDKHIVWHICKKDSVNFITRRDINNDMFVSLTGGQMEFLIRDKGSASELVSSIRLEIETSKRERVGILLDADENIDARWKEIKNQCSRAGIQIPDAPQRGGTIVAEKDNSPRIGIWLMPDNHSRGEIEDFALHMIPITDTVWRRSMNYIQRIPLRDRRFDKMKTDKAKVFAWLATRREPGRIGASIGTGDLQTNGVLCHDFVGWITKLFS